MGSFANAVTLDGESWPNKEKPTPTRSRLCHKHAVEVPMTAEMPKRQGDQKELEEQVIGRWSLVSVLRRELFPDYHGQN